MYSEQKKPGNLVWKIRYLSVKMGTFFEKSRCSNLILKINGELPNMTKILNNKQLVRSFFIQYKYLNLHHLITVCIVLILPCYDSDPSPPLCLNRPPPFLHKKSPSTTDWNQNQPLGEANFLKQSENFPIE